MKTLPDWEESYAQEFFRHHLGIKSKLSSFKKAGEGLMNFAFRARFENGESLILKQSPPYCAGFPDIYAPTERILVENSFYDFCSKNEGLKSDTPKVIKLWPEHNLMAMEDLGKGPDFEGVYTGELELSFQEFRKLCSHLSTLHHSSIPSSFPLNNEMKKLNHDYIFKLPFNISDHRPDGLDDITPGLLKLRDTIRKDQDLLSKVEVLGEKFLNRKNALIHGDFYPRSWYKSKGHTLKVLDCEFAFVGPCEFDTGVFMAHLVLSQSHKSFFKNFLENYSPPQDYSHKLALSFAGVEIIRRIIFVSQLPFSREYEFKKNCLELATSLIKRPTTTNLERFL